MFSQFLYAAVSSRLDERGRTWWAEAFAAVKRDPSAALEIKWSGAGRRLGRGAVVFSGEERTALGAASAPFLPDGWGLDEMGRVALLLVAIERLPSEGHGAAVDDLFRKGEMREQQAVLKGLAYLPDPARFCSIGVEAVRSNVLSVLEAITTDNPYPAEFFPEAAWNQMIMKALFNGIPLGAVRGLERRRNAELVRMVMDYSAERRAAGRPVPVDADLILEGATDASL